MISDIGPYVSLTELSPRGSGNRDAIVFVHGIAGHPFNSWGNPGGPGAFLTRLGNRVGNVNIFTGGYRSDLEAIFSDKQLTLEALVSGWHDLLLNQVLAHHDRVVIVAHCLGGLLTTMATQKLDQDCPLVTPPRLCFILMETLFQLPPKHQRRLGSGGIVEGLSCRLPHFNDHWAFWTPIFEGRKKPNFYVQPFAILGNNSDGFAAPWRPDAFLSPDRLRHCDLAHEDLSRAPQSGPFAPLDYSVDICRQFLGSDSEPEWQDQNRAKSSVYSQSVRHKSN